MPASDHYRALARRPMSLSAMITSEDDRWDLPVQIVDLGLGGARVAVESEIEVGSPVRLTMVSPNRWDPLVIEGVVVWSQVPEGQLPLAGIRFVHSTGAAVCALADLIASHAFE